MKGLALYRTIFSSAVTHARGRRQHPLDVDVQRGERHHQHGLASIGVQGPAWLADPLWAKPAIIFMAVWGAGNSMVIFLAGLQDVSHTVYEASIIDGANWASACSR